MPTQLAHKLQPPTTLASVFQFAVQSTGPSTHVYALVFGSQKQHILLKLHCKNTGESLEFLSRKLRRRPPTNDLAAFRAKQNELRQHAVTQEQLNPVSFFLENSWTDKDDKKLYQNNTMLRMA